jgi:hypothetical protein
MDFAEDSYSSKLSNQTEITTTEGNTAILALMKYNGGRRPCAPTGLAIKTRSNEIQ